MGWEGIGSSCWCMYKYMYIYIQGRGDADVNDFLSKVGEERG